MSDLRPLVEIVQKTIYPRQVKDLERANYLIRSFIIGDYAPETPPIPTGAAVACVGSCFADEMTKSLVAQGKPVIPLILSERWNTAFAVRHLVEHAIDNTPFPEGFIAPHLKFNAFAFDKLRAAGAYIITLGLSICWVEIATNRMVMDIKDGHAARALAAALATHTMRQTSVAENVEQIAAIVASIRRANPLAPIIFTLSPVPLFLSLTDYPSIPSNTISKATLRVALHEIMERRLDNVFYWPSYEIVEWVGKYIRLVWGQDGNDLRHLQPAFIDEIMQRFAKLYFEN